MDVADNDESWTHTLSVQHGAVGGGGPNYYITIINMKIQLKKLKEGELPNF